MRHRGILRLGVAITALTLAAAGCRPSQTCVERTAELEDMAVETIAFVTADGRRIRTSAWIADEPAQQRAGFQHLCPETVARRPMWFQFQRPARVGFHMHNVHAPLDLAFVDAAGVVFEIRRMTPVSRERPARTVLPDRPIVAAVEAADGWFARRGIEPGARATREPSKRAQ